MKLNEVIDALEQFAPLPLQDEYDNAGLQIGLTEAEDVTGALLCLDVTEEVVREAAVRGLNLIVAHHPLLFHPLRQVAGCSQAERCTMMAVREGIAVYAAHTNLDNAVGGVNWEMARRLGLNDVAPLTVDGAKAAGAVGVLPNPQSELDFLELLKGTFHTSALLHNRLNGRMIQRVALCGGAGAFMLKDAIGVGADAFVTGEIHYHDFFGHDDELLMVAMGHYESEQYTVDLFERVLHERFPELRIVKSAVKTNPIFVY